VQRGRSSGDWTGTVTAGRQGVYFGCTIFHVRGGLLCSKQTGIRAGRGWAKRMDNREGMGWVGGIEIGCNWVGATECISVVAGISSCQMAFAAEGCSRCKMA
jgi:hypothetical protein